VRHPKDESCSLLIEAGHAVSMNAMVKLLKQRELPTLGEEALLILDLNMQDHTVWGWRSPVLGQESDFVDL
jgi:hypothetical protein